MKKIISLFLVFIISIGLYYSQSNASDSETIYKNKIFKQAIITRNELRKLNNGDKIINLIETFFIKNRLKSENLRMKELIDLNQKLIMILDSFERISYLNTEEKNQKLLVENLFYRTTLELNY